MKNITKADIVDNVSKATGITKVDTKIVLEGVFTSIIDAIADGNKIEIRGFGVFHSKKRKARFARNPKTGVLVPLKERHVPLFKASDNFAQKINDRIYGKVKTETSTTDSTSNTENTDFVSGSVHNNNFGF